MPERITLKEVDEAIRDVYLIKDPHVIKMFMALPITHRLPMDPVWCFLIAPPGGGKTELIKSLTGLNNVHPVTTLTSHTLISGQKKVGQETSLLLKISNGIITIEDFTTLMSENQDERRIIMGQLRSIYGGRYDKSFGTGDNITWEGKITIVAGTTYAVHSFRELYASMGERFLMYSIEQPDRKEAAKRTMENHAQGIDAMRNRIANVVQAYHNSFEIPDKMPEVPRKLQDELLDLAELATRARSAVEREMHSQQKEILEAYPPEMPTRFAAQLQTVAIALMLMNKHEGKKAELTEDDMTIIYKLGLDSINRSRRQALIQLAQYEIVETAGLAMKMNFPTGTTRRWLEDLNALGIIDRAKGSGSKSDRWILKENYREIIQRFEHVASAGGTLTQNSAEAEAPEGAILEGDHDETVDMKEENERANEEWERMTGGES